MVSLTMMTTRNQVLDAKSYLSHVCLLTLMVSRWTGCNIFSQSGKHAQIERMSQKADDVVHRRDAKRLPNVTRAKLPEHLQQQSNDASDSAEFGAESSNVSNSSKGKQPAKAGPCLPSDEWRAVFLSRFKNFRKVCPCFLPPKLCPHALSLARTPVSKPSPLISPSPRIHRRD